MMNFSMEGKKSQDLVNLFLAVCLFLSPWVVGFSLEAMPAWNAWIVGIVLGALAIATLSVFAEWEEWVNLVLGLWLIVAPWMLGFTASMSAMWTHIVLGVLVAALSAWAVWDYRHHPHSHA
ncbi:SPW repeat protein [Rhizobiaceae bacterium n13]|uniref:SPW repeat protein n=1 Tax=Ferirhizobium litorale TaxID=2927786 RepID=A0AAE3QGG8_9HYPH|nr:SPW repeat protein [Fererhizobium litorale]MDI7861984.1 SPW repeat protein [Fererhizobium litorale]MDI7922744.1 SPW repeat protein [Fererhizobium litorale]